MRNSHGFTLIEFIISIVILSVAIFGLMSLSDRLKTANSKSRLVTAAMALGQERMEFLKRNSLTVAAFPNVTTVAPAAVTGTPFTVRTEVKRDYPVTDMKDITVYVVWQNYSVALQTQVLKPVK